MRLSYIGIFISTSLFLSACADNGTLSNGSQVTQMTANQNPAVYTQTNNAATAPAVEIQYVPVPVSGQLMPIPSTRQAATTPTFNTPTAAIDYANKQATMKPSSTSQFFNAMMTYDYMPGALYTIYTSPMHLTDITLAPGEKVISEAAGDTLRWQVAQTYNGSGDTITQHILVKPLEVLNPPDDTNTLIINTDQRVYHLLLKSDAASYMAAVQWRYGNDMVTQGTTPPMPDLSSTDPTPGSSPQVNLNTLDFNYQFGMLKGSQPVWYPLRIFNDGRQTYIQLQSNNYSQTQLPALFVANDAGVYGTATVNWRYRSPYIIVDAVVQDARLQTGVDNTDPTIVQIKYTGQQTGP